MSALFRIEDRLFSGRRLAIGAAILITCSALDLAWQYGSGQWIFDRHGQLRLFDFIWVWTGGKLALGGSAIKAFDYSSFAAPQRDLVGAIGPNRNYFHWNYAPVVFFLAAPFALLPYLPAFAAWTIATGSLYVSAIRKILGRRSAPLLALSPSVAALNLMLGQTGFLLAGIMGLALALMDCRPFLGGAVLGLLAFKPQLALLFPIVLIAAGRWRIVAGAALSVLALVGASAAAFGPESWLVFAQSLPAHDPRTLMSDPGVAATLQTVFGIFGRLGFGLRAAWTAQIGVGALAAVLACVLWRRRLPYELKAAALSAATLLATPYLLAYDLVMIVVPAAFLIRLGLLSGFLAGERLVLLSCFLASLAFVFPVGPFILAALIALVLRRAIARPGDPASGPALRVETCWGIGSERTGVP